MLASPHGVPLLLLLLLLLSAASLAPSGDSVPHGNRESELTTARPGQPSFREEHSRNSNFVSVVRGARSYLQRDADREVLVAIPTEAFNEL